MINEYLINGPNNVVRLSNGDKILYIFGDNHLSIDNQKECALNDNYDSIDLDKLLFKFMKEEKNRNFDLFIEDFKYYFKPENNNTNRKIYINQISKLFKANIIIENNKILTNKKYSNFKFHYFDIRIEFDLMKNIFYYCELFFYFPYEIIDCLHIINNTENIIYLLKNFLDNIEYYNKNNFINKILNKYENKKIQKIINNIYNKYFIQNINFIIKNSQKLINLINKSIKKLEDNFHDKEKYIIIAKDIYIKFINNQRLLLGLTSIISDLYFIRRFLDKEYIKNGILYTGLAHLSNIVYLLTKYFNYKLTHAYYTNKKLDQITKIKSNHLSHIHDLLVVFSSYDKLYRITQCINLFNFPKNFS